MGTTTYKGFQIGTQVDGTVYARRGSKWLLSATVNSVKAMVDALIRQEFQPCES